MNDIKIIKIPDYKFKTDLIGAIIDHRVLNRGEIVWNFHPDSTVSDIVEEILRRFCHVIPTRDTIKHISKNISFTDELYKLSELNESVFKEVGLNDDQIKQFQKITYRYVEEKELFTKDIKMLLTILSTEQLKETKPNN